MLASGATVSLGSIVGLLAVIGIAARNALYLIDRFLQLERVERMPFGAPLVLRGVRERLTPILASTLAIIVLLAPILVLGNAPGLEIIRPTAFVIIGGLVAATLVTLLVVPAMYLGFGAKAQRQFDLGIDRDAREIPEEFRAA